MGWLSLIDTRGACDACSPPTWSMCPPAARRWPATDRLLARRRAASSERERRGLPLMVMHPRADEAQQE